MLFGWITNFILWILGKGGENYVGNISYRFYDSDASNTLYTWKSGSENFAKLSCARDGPLSYVFTGFKENNNAVWLNDLRKNLQKERNGCLVVVDYWKYSAVDITKYAEVLLHYNNIVAEVSKQYSNTIAAGFKASNTYFFGFSFGAQVALGVGNSVKGKVGKVQRIDACEPTALGFFGNFNFKDCATNVQCIHTNSLMFGTMKRECHQDWNMGNCGMLQTINVNLTSHAQCPLFYNSAFQNNFLAIEKPAACVVRGTLGTYPTGFKMGYKEERTEITGEFYAKTALLPPYTG